MTAAPRILFVGLDAMDANLVDVLMRDGRLPTLAALSARSLRASTVNPDGLVVGAVWPSIWSGTGPGTHGFYCFRQFVPGTYEVRRRTPEDIEVQPFWMRLADLGRRVAVVDMPLTRLTAPTGGMHVVDLGTHDRMLQPQAFPAGLLADLAAAHGPHPMGRCDDYTTSGRQAEAVRDLAAGTRWRAELCADLLARDQWDLFATVFSESHCAGHQLWCTHDPAWPGHHAGRAEEQVAGGDGLVATYEAIDTALGALIGRADTNTRVAVLMSHGIGAHHDGDHLLVEIVRRLQLADPERTVNAARRWTEAVRRRAARALRSLRGRRHPGDPRFHRVTNVDAAQRFFVVPNNGLFGAVRLNLVGRERRGQVRRGADADRVLDRLGHELLQLTDPATGNPVVRRVLRVDDLYGGPRRDHLPDLLIDWDRSGPILAATSPTIGLVEGAPVALRSGDHRLSGRLLLSGPGIPAGELGRRIDVVDIAPTLCAWLDADLPDAEGRPIAEALTGTTPGT